MAAHSKEVKVIPNNCISAIKVPQKVKSVHGVDYNPVFCLYATFDEDNDGKVSVWNPANGKVVAQFGYFCHLDDVLFIPGNRLAVSSYRENGEGIIEIFNLEKIQSSSFEFVLLTRDEDYEKDDRVDDEDEESSEDDEEEYPKAEIIIDGRDLPLSYPGPLAFSPGGNLLVADALEGSAVYEIFIDWENLKFLKSKEILPGHEQADESVIRVLCCPMNPEVQVAMLVSAMLNFEPRMILCTTVSLNSKGDVETWKQEKITYFMLNGEEKSVKEYGLVTLLHDGQNLIIASEDEIVLLESMTEGSTAHLIASGVKLSGQMRLNHEGQLIVCEEKVIRLFNYKCKLRSLLELCRSNLRKSIRIKYIVKVNSLEIPSVLKKYLLFKYN